MSQQRFYPTTGFLLAVVVPGAFLGAAVGGLQFVDSPRFDLLETMSNGILAGAITMVPTYIVGRSMFRFVVNARGIGARDATGRWRTVRWGDLSGVRSATILGVPFTVVSSTKLRGSLWLPGRVSRHEQLLKTLATVGPPADAVRTEFARA